MIDLKLTMKDICSSCILVCANEMSSKSNSMVYANRMLNIADLVFSCFMRKPPGWFNIYFFQFFFPWMTDYVLYDANVY